MLLTSASMLPVLWLRLEILVPTTGTCRLDLRLDLRLRSSLLLAPAMFIKLLLLPVRQRESRRGLAWATEMRRRELLGLLLADRCLKAAAVDLVDR